MTLFAAALASYLLGSVPTAYLLLKWTKRIDIRTVGSGNVGATNALRIAGVGVGATVFVIDALKGAIPAVVFARWADPSAPPALLCGTAAVIGHVFPCFLRFQGGKGVATTIGALVGSDPLTAGAVLLVWAGTFAMSRFVSIASIAAAAAIPIAQGILHRPSLQLWLGGSLALLIIARHRSNIQRLLASSEYRAWSRNKRSG